MNRELKFRVYDIDNKRMIIQSPYQSNHAFLLTPNGLVYKQGVLQNYVIMQYTGLKDKNGKEIYENDIVNVRNWGRTDEVLMVSMVEWDIDENGWGLAPSPTDDRYDLFRNIEVIGNIYENPELIDA